MRYGLMGALAATSMLLACTPATSDPAGEAKAAYAAYVEAVNNGDPEAIITMYDTNPGFHWVEQGRVQYSSGKEASASFAQLAQSSSKIKMTTDAVQVAVLSETSALVSSHFDFSLQNADGEEQFAFDGWMTVGMAKREDGWKIAGGQTGPGRQDTDDTVQ